MEHDHIHHTGPAMEHDMSQHHAAGMHAAHGHAGHDHSAMIADFRKRFFVVAALTIPVMLLSPMIQFWLGVHWQFTGSSYILFALSTFVFVYGGYPFLKGFASEMRSGNPGMMTLIAVAITVAYGYSTATIFGLKGMDFFWELDTLILIMLLGHWIEMRSIAGASRELELLVQLMPSDAHMVHGDHIMDVKIEDLKPGDLILIKPGEKVSADGLITEGESSLNESMLTGESTPVLKQKGNKVIAGSINGNGALRVEVTHSAAESYLAQVIKLVNEAQQSKSNTQLLADRAAKWLTLIALVSGAATFIVWYFVAGRDLAFAIERTVTVIVICCPHALGLAIPLVVARSTALSARHGLLIKNRTAFENSRKITTLVFDKTGTLTIGKFMVTRIGSFDPKYPESKLLQIAAALEQNSEHPIATGIVQKAKNDQVTLPAATDFKAITGVGIEAVIDGQKAMVVSPRYMKDTFPGFKLPETDMAETVVYIIIENNAAGFIALADKIRDESFDAIAVLKSNHIRTILLTGDNKQVAESVSHKLAMDGYYAEILPHQKLDKIKELQSKGEYVAMTGDGVNDAPALAQADVSIAVGSGSDIAAETAGIVLVNSNPKDIVSLILFGKATYRKMIQNLIWATAYNVIALPLAAGVLYRQGIMLQPAAGAVLMTLSTVVVAINASLLRVKTFTQN